MTTLGCTQKWSTLEGGHNREVQTQVKIDLGYKKIELQIRYENSKIFFHNQYFCEKKSGSFPQIFGNEKEKNLLELGPKFQGIQN